MANERDLKNAREIAKANEAAAKTAKERAAYEKDIRDYSNASLRASLSARGITKEEFLDAQKRAREEAEITKEKKEQAKIGLKTASLTSKVNKLLKSGAGAILEQSNLTKTLNVSMEQAQKHTGDVQKGYNLITEAQLTGIQAIKDGTMNAKEFMANLEEQFEGMSEEAKSSFESMRDDLKKFAEDAEKAGEGLSDALNIDAKDLDGLEGAREKLKQFSAIASSPTLMGAAAIGLALKLITDFAKEAVEVRQELGTTAVDSARIAGNMKIAALQAKAFGGNEEEARKAVSAINREFGSLDASSGNVSRLAGKITAQFGIGGENLAKLTKQMSVLNGESLETNINTLETVGNLARAARVAPADVLNDMAENTESFAKFSKDGGANLAEAAIEARKLGLNLSTVDKIAESLLDVEGSIEKQMEASVLLGRQLNLDRARQLSLEGDLVGLQKEIVKQVGGAEQLSKMNVVQRKALADAVGVEVSELTKLAAGQKAVTEESEKSAGSMGKFVIAGAAAGAVVGLIGGALVSIIPGIIASTGIGATIAGAMQKQGLKTLGKGAAMGGAVGALAGGVIGGASTKAKGLLPANTTKMAEGGVLVGEAGVEAVLPLPAAGIKTDMTESNTLLRQLISQNEVLMNKLTNKVSDLALSS